MIDGMNSNQQADSLAFMERQGKRIQEMALGNGISTAKCPSFLFILVQVSASFTMCLPLTTKTFDLTPAGLGFHAEDGESFLAGWGWMRPKC